MLLGSKINLNQSVLVQSFIKQKNYNKRIMNVKLKAILKTTDTLFEPFQQNQFIFQAGSNLAIKQFNKPACEFIHLTKQLIQLYSFKPAPNKKACFVAEKITQDKICISQYSLKKQRKCVCISDSPQFFPSSIIESVELLADQIDSFIVYGIAKAGGDTCIFLVDFNKLKIVSIGFAAAFNDIKVNNQQSLTLSMCYANSVRTAHVYNGFWQTEEKVFKKLGNINIIRHQIFESEMLLLCTRTQMLLMNNSSELIQTINVFENNEDEIEEVIKLAKGILILSRKQKMKIYVQDHDEVNHIEKGQVSIILKENEKISKLVLSSNYQEVLLRTNLNEIFVWKVEDLEAANEICYEFQKVQSGTIDQNKGQLSLASGKQIALLANDTSITLWDLEKNSGFFESKFTKLDAQAEKALYAASLNPDGNSLICAFEDKVKIYKILLTKIRFIAEFGIKKCTQLLHSHGGQYVSCKYGKGANSTITILNTLRMTEIATIKIHDEPLFTLWNEMDDQLVVATESNLITSYKISDSMKSCSLKIPEKINMIRIDYLTKMLLVSSNKQIYVVDKDRIQKVLQPKIPKFNFIYPLHGIYFITTKDGNLYWSHQIGFDTYNELPIFANKPFNILYKNGYMLASSSFSNITIIQCMRQHLPLKKKILKTSEEIVFVERDQIIKFFQKIKNLETSVENLQNSTTLRLQEQRNKFQQSLRNSTLKFQEQISYLQKRYNQMSNEKLKQQKQNNKVFDQLQFGQVKSVNDLEKMYDRKLKLQKDKCMEMEQKNVEQKLHYEKVIYQIEKRYHDDIIKVRQQYANKIAQQCKKIEQSRKNDLEYKKKMEYKMISLEEESDMTIFEVQKAKDDKIQELQKFILKLESQENKNKVEFHNELSRYKTMGQQFINLKQDLKKHKEKLSQAYERIKLLQEQISSRNRMVEQRNNVISQQEHQIGGLQKAKYVLSFRTTEIRKQLEPKQSLIDKLKHQLFKIDEEYSLQKNKSYQLNQKLQKVDKLNKILKEENIQLTTKFKNKKRINDEMSGEIFTIVNQMDQKEWPSALVKFYQTYIKQDHFKNVKKKSQQTTSEEINRHLIHVEQSLMQVTAGNQKILKAKDLDTKRKMKQNADLIFDFNELKKIYNQRLKQIDEYKIKISKLQQEIHESNKNSTRANTAKTGTRKIVSRQKTNQKGDMSNLDFSFKRQSQIYFEKREIQTRQSRNRASSSGYRTMILKSDKKENSRFFDLAKELEGAKYKLQKQQKMIEELNARLLEQSIS